jgi:hypothetical protein
MLKKAFILSTIQEENYLKRLTWNGKDFFLYHLERQKELAYCNFYYIDQTRHVWLNENERLLGRLRGITAHETKRYDHTLYDDKNDLYFAIIE